ncbi:aminodeoxychorismate synthase component I [Pseudotabrizicola sediminis]|uniref:Aminodeoxychorismate synthase component I n=1 Tax=Pseudotabrizicola sediminis TaxID=2486418 RepID=A0ABY2KP63_9RHOB|nr:aminodeoxychorismate synthase component I [Pseudotabrizicola sediminis]TGD44439.1 aminodeoxychorismate synthase component I [Pseudotabrizicola sediminis]
MIVIEHGPGGRAAVFAQPWALFVAHEADEVEACLAAAESARAAGAWIAGYIAYEAGYALEPRLAARMPEGRRGPLVCLAAFEGPEEAGAALTQATEAGRGVRLEPLQPCVTREAYGKAFARVQGYIAAGDCYQINLTFPIASRLSGGTALGLYGALRVGQPVGYGAFVDLGVGPVVVSRSPELFFRVTGGVIESRPMKGTAPRSDDPVEDAGLAAALQASEKDRAENLMIVDLLRNDIARMSQVGSVKVPELYAVESFATVHQMSSRVQGRLLPGAGLPGLMAALFPCGSVTGAPKIRAMEIIAQVEAEPRGVYCGAVGWAAPDGDQGWSVAIRTARVWPDGEVRLNVGGGVVYDSTADGEWEEALWKTRFATGLTRRG